LAHRRQIDVLVMRMGDHERLLNTEAKHVLHDLACPIRDSGAMKCK
jgi:hypothetical protein